MAKSRSAVLYLLTCVLPLVLSLPQRSRVSIEDNLIEGKYQEVSKSNFQAYMNALEVPWHLQLFANVNTATATISRSCPSTGLPLSSPRCSWTIYTTSPVRSHSVTFRFGQEVNDYTIDNRDVKAVYTLRRSNVIEEVQRSSKSTNYITRTFTPNGIRMDLRVNGVRASMNFRRID